MASPPWSIEDKLLFQAALVKYKQYVLSCVS